MSKIVGSIVLLFIYLGSSAQVNRYMVFFKDKDNVSFSIDAPEEFLSERALERRSRFGIDINIGDLPVDPNYVQTLRESDVEVYFTTRWMNGALVQMDESRVTQIASLAFVSKVEYIAPGAKLTPEKSEVTIAEEFKEPAYQYSSSELQLGMLNVDDMHEDGYTGEGILVAVFDAGFTGVNEFRPFEHLFAQDKVVGYRDFVFDSGNPFQYHDHGTEVLSCISAYYPNLYGTAYDASVILAVTEDVQSEFRIEEYNWLLAAEFADSLGADIIHSSLGYSVFGRAPEMNYTYDDLDGQTATVTKAANLATERGILVVTSAGNEGNSSWQYITAPADAPNILAVGAINDNYQKASFSSVGPTADGRIKPDVVALGTGVALMFGSGGISTSNGTSYAAPLIAGMAASVWQMKPELRNTDLADLMRNASSRSFNPDTIYGYGIPNYRSLTGATLSIDQIVNRDIKVYPNPFRGNRITIDMKTAMDIADFSIAVYDQKGTLLLAEEYDRPIEQIVLEIPEIKPGAYFLKINSDLFSKTVKLIKN